MVIEGDGDRRESASVDLTMGKKIKNEAAGGSVDGKTIGVHGILLC